MADRVRRRRPCQLAVPGSSLRKIESALRLGVDHVFLDLEDAVSPALKPEARKNVVRAFNEMDWGNTVRCFRMNGLDTSWAYQDLIEVVETAGNNIDTVLVPKVKEPRDAHFVKTLLQQIELHKGFTRRIGLELMIEEVEGLAR
jgi:citrate lyase subunit beta/citryl-CoA lyase